MPGAEDIQGVDNAVWKELLAVAAKFDATHAGGLPLPQNFEETRNFVRVVQEFLGEFPSSFGYGCADEKMRHRQVTSVELTEHGVYAKKHRAEDRALGAVLLPGVRVAGLVGRHACRNLS